MPVATFPGERNWGYDGVYLCSRRTTAYGGPDGLTRLVDACHAHGLALIVDVVYNHLGPEGNYLGDFGPYFTDRYRTPWGDALNFDGPDSDEVRRFFVDNALHWLTRLPRRRAAPRRHPRHLRLSARATSSPRSPTRFTPRRPASGADAWLIAESDLQRSARHPADGRSAGWASTRSGATIFTTRCTRVVTGNRRGYFVDFGGVADLGQGDHATASSTTGSTSAFPPAAARRARGGAPGERFVAFIQNHDQIANAYQGRRLGQVVGLERQKVAATVLFSTPALPLLFQGEEYGEEAPFDYFTSHGDPALAEAVRQGRHQEYLHLLEEGAEIGSWADPQAEETFQRCEAALGVDRPRAARGDAGVLPRADRAAPAAGAAPQRAQGSRPRRRDEAGRWLTIERGDPGGAATFTCANFGDAPARDSTLPDGAWELALATQPSVSASATLTGGDVVTLPPSTALIYERVGSARRLAQARRAGARIGAEHDALAAVPGAEGAVRRERARAARPEHHRQAGSPSARRPEATAPERPPGATAPLSALA